MANTRRVCNDEKHKGAKKKLGSGVVKKKVVKKPVKKKKAKVVKKKIDRKGG